VAHLSTKPPDEVKMKIAKIVQDAIIASMPQLEQEGFDPLLTSIQSVTSCQTSIRMRGKDGRNRFFIIKLAESY
jgi:hypothetical protein